jgi:hypothetical protein
MILLNFSIFFWDFYAGINTLPLFILEPYSGVAMFYVYMISGFSSFLVLNAIIRSKQFGMGLLIWLPYAIIGVFVETYFELIVNPVLKGFWVVILYCLFGLITGFSADISYYYLNKKVNLNRGVLVGLTGMIMSLVYFFTTLIAISTFYKNSKPLSWTDPTTFTGLAYFGIPWMLIHAFIGGLAAFGFNKMKFPIDEK